MSKSQGRIRYRTSNDREGVGFTRVCGSNSFAYVELLLLNASFSLRRLFVRSALYAFFFASFRAFAFRRWLALFFRVFCPVLVELICLAPLGIGILW